MTEERTPASPSRTPATSWGYGILVAMMALTGFAQMPIFKRYYVADMPGLGWLAEFYVTHLIHYGLAAVFLGVYTAWTIEHLLARSVMKKESKLGGMTWTSAISAMLLCSSGAVLVWKNFSGVFLPHGLIIVLNLVHLMAAVVFVTISAMLGIRIRSRRAGPSPKSSPSIQNKKIHKKV